MIDYAAVLSAKYPNALWGMNDNDLATLVWDESNIDPKPSQAELDAAWPEVQQARQQKQTDALRHAAYVAESDPLFFQWQRGEATEQAWRDKVAEIQARYPEPSGA